MKKKIVPNQIGENKSLQFLKKWIYILYNKNNIVKECNHIEGSLSLEQC